MDTYQDVILMLSCTGPHPRSLIVHPTVLGLSQVGYLLFAAGTVSRHNMDVFLNRFSFLGNVDLLVTIYFILVL